MVGFLAAHKLLSSSFGKGLEDYDLKKKLREKARAITNTISFQFLDCALEGVFSELLYLAFGDLSLYEYRKEHLDRFQLEKEVTEQIEYLLKWGHSSGTDALTGTVFGLWTICIT